MRQKIADFLAFILMLLLFGGPFIYAAFHQSELTDQDRQALQNLILLMPD